MSENTPGPWYVDGEDVCTYKNGAPRVICTAVTCDVEEEEAEANLELIASAQDLQDEMDRVAEKIVQLSAERDVLAEQVRDLREALEELTEAHDANRSIEDIDIALRAARVVVGRRNQPDKEESDVPN